MSVCSYTYSLHPHPTLDSDIDLILTLRQSSVYLSIQMSNRYPKHSVLKIVFIESTSLALQVMHIWTNCWQHQLPRSWFFFPLSSGPLSYPHPVRLLCPGYLWKGILFPCCQTSLCTNTMCHWSLQAFFSTQERQNNLEVQNWPNHSTPEYARFTLPACFVPLCFASPLVLYILAGCAFHTPLPSGSQYTPTHLQKTFSYHFAWPSPIQTSSLS